MCKFVARKVGIMFVARQPIFDKRMKVYGYELLFRANQESNSFSNTSAKSATALVMGDLFELGISKVTGNAKAFVNFDYEFLMSDMIELIDPETLVIEVLETVIIDDRLLERIKELRKKGYKIALDDFEEDYFTFEAVPIVDIIKYDILSTPLDTIIVEVKEALSNKKILLAEKIETEKEYLEAKSMGFQLFQGYFFSKPKIIEKKKKKKSSKTIYTQILNEIKAKDFSYDKLTKMIESDVDLSYRLLSVLSRKNNDNSYGSIRYALVRMGKKEIERWISVLMMQNIADDKPDEIFRISLIRSKFGEMVSDHSIFRQRKEEVAMMCLFSMLDVLLDCTMKEALEELNISEDIVKGLVEHAGIYRPLGMLLEGYEKGDWEQVKIYCEELNVDSNKLSDWYMSAIEWTNSLIDV